MLARVEEFAAGLVRVIPPHAHALEGLVDITPRCADVVTGRKMLTRAAQNNDLDRIVINGALECRIQRIGHLRILGVVETGAVQGDARHRAVNAIQHGFLGFINAVVMARGEFARLVIVHVRTPGFGAVRCGWRRNRQWTE
ncbi:hypothetical protein D9M68_585840 [compost metagenome]